LRNFTSSLSYSGGGGGGEGSLRYEFSKVSSLMYLLYEMTILLNVENFYQSVVEARKVSEQHPSVKRDMYIWKKYLKYRHPD